MIKQIQLRGISRTPSDRATEDGGLAESLNVILDSNECAPVLEPKLMNESLGLPEDLQAERIFIHKTANYENIIVVQSNKVVAYTPQIEDEEPLKVIDLANGEDVNDITSVGNTLIISTTANLYYILFDRREYKLLGNKIPFPYIGFTRTEVSDFADDIELSHSVDNHSSSGGGTWFVSIFNDTPEYIPSEEDWNEDSSETENHKGKILSFLQNLWTSAEEQINEKKKSGYLVTPIVIRYAVELYEGSVSSIPVLIPSLTGESFNIEVSTQKYNLYDFISDGEGGVSAYETVYIEENAKFNAHLQAYKILAKMLSEDDLMNWADVIKSISIYVSTPSPLAIRKYASVLSNRQESYITGSQGEYPHYDIKSSGLINFRKIDFEDELLAQTALVFQIKKIDVFNEEKTSISDEMKSLIQGEVLDLSKYLNPGQPDFVQLESQEPLKNDDMKHYVQTANRVSTYNNKLILIQPSQLIDYDYARMNAYDKTAGDKTKRDTIVFDVTYLLRGSTEDKVVRKKFTYKTNAHQSETIYAFQIFPDSRAYKMLIKATKTSIGGTVDVKYGEFDMFPNPYLDCAYYYGGVEEKLRDLCDKEEQDELEENVVDDLDNKLIMSETDYSFVFPIQNRYTFQSKVLGVAIATTTLSQGQFGQFPLYVFTEDGIWAMETAADGSFVTSKPLSREVCINPESITSIDNAVVFVSSKGVMMISGSQVVNLSPNMNGKHYSLDEKSQGVLEGEEFGHLNKTLADENPFMKFMTTASCAYDYAGQRLIFIKEGEEYQYVYKIDTQTWHKTAYAEQLTAPLNSYPECLVMASGEQKQRKFLNILSIADSQLSEDELTADFIERFSNYNLDYEHVFSVFQMVNRLDITDWSDADINELEYLDSDYVLYEIQEEAYTSKKVLDFSTILDVADPQPALKGCIITRPFDLGEPDVFKTIKDLRIRGYYEKGHVRYLLQGSNDGLNFYLLHSLRGKSWKMFRLIILSDLQPHERITWVDVDYEARYKNRLR